ncbi:MAG: S9 family peptidase [Bacteroidales bacterium]|nr:S9 family peptidase [Bacteroidales bacterium]
MKKTIITLLCLCLGVATFAQELTLESVIRGNLLHNRGGGGLSWFDGDHYYKYDQVKGGGVEMAKYNVANDERTVLIPASMLINPTTGKQFAIRNIIWSEDGERVLIYTNTKRVWRYDTRGDYWYLNVKTGKVAQVGEGLPESSLMFAKFSPDSKKIAYVSKNNVYVEAIDESNGLKLVRTQLTTDGDERIVNGTFDWAYEEEFSCRDGIRWSPDSKYVAFWQSDTEGTGTFAMINNIDSIYATIQEFPYPKAGTPNSAVKIGYVAADGGNITWVPIPGDPRNNYLPRMEFIPGSNELFIQQMNREQNTNKIWVVSLADNQPKNIFTDTDAAWLDTNDDIMWLKNNTWFTWLSERDGWRHMYRISRDGKQIVPVTKGDFDFISAVGTDMKSGVVYFMASPENYTQRYLYKAKLFGNGSVERVSPANQSGQHSYNISPNGKWAVHTYSNASTPNYIEKISLPNHKTLQVIETNEYAKEAYAKLGLNPKEFVKAKSGDLELDAWIIKPRDFDPNKKYPVIVYVYGEPASATVNDAWEGGYLWDQLQANQGYIVVSIENRGANAPRGREWRKCIYGEVGTFASEDQARGIMDLCRKYNYMDSTRIGINGWSGGGSQTLNCMFRYPEVFKAGIAIAFVADQRTYDNIYQERYMNTPQNNPEGYKKGSPISHAAGLKGELLMIHGTGDDNVHYQNMELMANELIRLGKTFYQISYPMRSHSISERANTTYHLRKSMLKFWKEKL